MNWILITFILIIGVIVVVGAIVGLLFLFGVFEFTSKQKGSSVKISANIPQHSNQSVSAITENTVVHFTYGRPEYVSDTENQRYIAYYPEGNGDGTIPPGCLAYIPGSGPATSNFLFTATIDAGSNKTNMGVYLNGQLVEGTSTGVGSPVSISKSFTLGANDIIGLYDIYLGNKSEWKAGSYYKLVEQ